MKACYEGHNIEAALVSPVVDKVGLQQSHICEASGSATCASNGARIRVYSGDPPGNRGQPLDQQTFATSDVERVTTMLCR